VTARFLLDTDWVIDHFNGIAAITRRLEQLRPSGLALSVISLAEPYEGVHYARDPAPSRRVLSRFVTGLTVVAVDEEICDIFGREEASFVLLIPLPSPSLSWIVVPREVRRG
jgi:tRNA(fMet)-specific endonuclease VapC